MKKSVSMKDATLLAIVGYFLSALVELVSTLVYNVYREEVIEFLEETFNVSGYEVYGWFLNPFWCCTSMLRVVSAILLCIFFIILYKKSVGMKGATLLAIVGSFLSALVALVSTLVYNVYREEETGFFVLFLRFMPILWVVSYILLCTFFIIFCKKSVSMKGATLLAIVGSFLSALVALVSTLVYNVYREEVIEFLEETFNVSKYEVYEEFFNPFWCCMSMLRVVSAILLCIFFIILFNRVYGGTHHWLSLNGRARRSEYWDIIILKLRLIGGLVLALFMLSVLKGRGGVAEVIVGLIMFGLIIGILFVPVGVRRCHDMNMSGWWLLAFFISGFIPFIGIIVGVVEFIMLGCLDGTPGTNRFGPSPKGYGSVEDYADDRGSTSYLNTNESGKININSRHGVIERMEEKLMKLKEAGIITESEYEEMFCRIMDEGK